ncbi:MAG TPA: TA system VapC family ribonuclease toxin [Vicinamibacterales bacterium]|nr:TA system VapC family ribonuclease toxin [Vicinamibacterales bacterium]
MSKPALLDVNVLVALFNPDHIHHDAAHDWFSEARLHGWATCPLTELGLVRILSNPAYWPGAERCAVVADRLRQFCASGHHQFWRDSLSLSDETFNWPLVKGHRQVTDIYLLGLAVKRGGALATFDRTIPLAAVAGAGPDAVRRLSVAE